MLYRDLTDARAVKRLLPGKHLIHGNAERIDVASRVGILAPRLLGRDIVYRAYRLALILMYLVFKRGNTEIADFNCSVAQQHDILGLDIAVNDPALMRVHKGFCDLLCKMQNLAPRERGLFIHVLPERDAVYKFHNYVLDNIAVADVIDRYNIGVRKHCDRVRLRAESAAKLLVRRRIVAHDLHGDISVEPVVKRLVNDRHSALADNLKDIVASVKKLSNIFIVCFH